MGESLNTQMSDYFPYPFSDPSDCLCGDVQLVGRISV